MSIGARTRISPASSPSESRRSSTPGKAAEPAHGLALTVNLCFSVTVRAAGVERRVDGGAGGGEASERQLDALAFAGGARSGHDGGDPGGHGDAVGQGAAAVAVEEG